MTAASAPAHAMRAEVARTTDVEDHADVRARTADGRTALSLAQQACRVDIAAQPRSGGAAA